MKAILFKDRNEGLVYTDTKLTKPSKGEILIQLHYAALNHRDIWIWKEQQLEKPVIPGSDGSGVVVETGEGIDASWIGKEVIINPSLHWGLNPIIQSEKFEILGYPTNGTFAEYISMTQQYIYEKPGHLNLEAAAALPLAGLTAYRALFTKAKLQSSDSVLITGIGGGVAIYLLQMAVATGCDVYVTSSSEKKILNAVQLGAKGGFNYNRTDWITEAKSLAGGFDVIIDSAGGNGFKLLTEVANPAGRIVVFGRTAGDINQLKPGLLFNKQLQILGTLMGTTDEFKAMLIFYQNYNLYPLIHKIFPLNEAEKAFNYLDGGSHFGKILLKIL